jgi:GrpB-like predicted nucleotidyltransferase (UPF0157 family)
VVIRSEHSPATTLQRRPNFFIVGAPRCGTTSMYSYLKQHPDVWVSILKEPHFFGSDLTIQPHTIRDEQLYLSLFADAGNRSRIGEGSVWYLASKQAAREIREYCPDANILIMLREPSEMIYSLYHLYRRTGNEDLPSFEAALDAEAERREGRRIPASAYFPEGLRYVEIARYADQVERYFDVFGRQNVHITLFEDLVADPAQMYQAVLKFLGIDPAFSAVFDRREAAARVRSTALWQLHRADPLVRAKLRSEGFRQHYSPLRPSLPAPLRARLKEALAGDVERLEGLLGQKLTRWYPAERVPVPVEGRGSGPGDAHRLNRALRTARILKRLKQRVEAYGGESIQERFARWQLIRSPDLPLEVCDYNPEWPQLFETEKARVLRALGDPLAEIEHFGSTAVPGTASKNIIDFFVAVHGPPVVPERIAALDKIGYKFYGNSPLDCEAFWFWHTNGACCAFVAHLSEIGKAWLDRVVVVRDYLRAHAEERNRYAALKKRLAVSEGQDSLGYSLEKIAFWHEVFERASAWRAASLEVSRDSSS